MPHDSRLIIRPNDNAAFIHPSIRKKWIQNLVDLLHTCLLKGDIPRAKRAWSILVRCREVNWKSRWYWGLLILSSDSSAQAPGGYESTIGSGDKSKDVQRWLNSLRVFAKEEDKPSLLHALVLHLIKAGQHRQAYDQLETWLSSYPYLLSGPLHTYAGLLSFYLAQPASTKLSSRTQHQDTRRSSSVSGSSRASSPPAFTPQADPAALRQARGWFVKALEIDQTDEVAKQFIALIDNPNQEDGADSDEESDRGDQSRGGLSDSETDTEAEMDEKPEEFDPSDSDQSVDHERHSSEDESASEEVVDEEAEDLVESDEKKKDEEEDIALSDKSWSSEYSDSYGR
ncbi:uncharacterized protein I303_107742 [Kwoniella dejecticola CBS 10117]|uniref:Uncharacterized protein n=1 Tax=Kwoniella dejecticola CBS 10117 TaxID=1296121 RepID=A0A1A5ZVK6_9TREE|nr:uncharacterized protein I303_07747 [Kwoniella dejecticola CBS 10117]OBR81837.1 hypothetical protein I303_07747 [Kwoniella dejecticola CBS 10117]